MRRARILVVDDDPLVSRAIRRVLSGDHEVVTCEGRIALERIRSGEEFDVIFCDVMMPDVTGLDFHAKLLDIAPGLLNRLVFMTGGAFSPDARAFIDRISNMCLDKPVSATTLRRVVAEKLAETAASQVAERHGAGEA